MPFWPQAWVELWCQFLGPTHPLPCLKIGGRNCVDWLHQFSSGYFGSKHQPIDNQLAQKIWTFRIWHAFTQFNIFLFSLTHKHKFVVSVFCVVFFVSVCCVGVLCRFFVSVCCVGVLRQFIASVYCVRFLRHFSCVSLLRFFFRRAAAPPAAGGYHLFADDCWRLTCVHSLYGAAQTQHLFSNLSYPVHGLTCKLLFIQMNTQLSFTSVGQWLLETSTNNQK